MSKPFQPVVIGAPRTGFALLTSVLSHLLPHAPRGWSRKQAVLDLFTDHLGGIVSDAILGAFAEAGVEEERLIFNDNFRYIRGGPKWLKKGDDTRACYRKYLGVPGMQDFTLVVSLPAETLAGDDIVHSHSDPSRWPDHAVFGAGTLFASQRNPVAVLNSACFSINALTSEYIQRFVPPDQDDHELREKLAIFKFTQPDFFTGLVTFLARYYQEFLEHRDRYVVMRWEDLIQRPEETIAGLADRAGIPLPAAEPARIWAALDHKNLTGAHKHNFRKGAGVIGDWQRWMVPWHLDVMREHGLFEITRELGYDEPIAPAEADFTPFQRKVADALEKGEVLDETEDRELFGFAFNKSNLDSEKFPFRRKGFREWTQLERSCFEDEALEEKVWDAAEPATAQLAELLVAILGEEWEDPAAGRASLARLKKGFEGRLGESRPVGWQQALASCERILEPRFDAGPVGTPGGFVGRVVGKVKRTLGAAPHIPRRPDAAPPRLVRTLPGHNIVRYDGLYFGLPHGLGERDLATDHVEALPGVVVHPSLPVVEASLDGG